MDDFTTIWVCQGEPGCDLEGDNAVAAQIAGCPYCKQIRLADDGTVTVIEPGRA